jgi:hypothetical protein
MRAAHILCPLSETKGAHCALGSLLSAQCSVLSAQCSVLNSVSTAIMLRESCSPTPQPARGALQPPYAQIFEGRSTDLFHVKQCGFWRLNLGDSSVRRPTVIDIEDLRSSVQLRIANVALRPDTQRERALESMFHVKHVPPTKLAAKSLSDDVQGSTTIPEKEKEPR